MFGIFGKKKKKEEKRVYVHPQLGEMEYYLDSWRPAFVYKAELWGKAFDVEIGFMADSEGEDINQEQEESYEKFKNVITEQRGAIEEMIVSTYTYTESEMDVRDRVVPYAVDFNRKGECALFFMDMEEKEIFELEPLSTGFAIFLVPELLFVDTEQCADCMSGNEDFGEIYCGYTGQDKYL